MSINKFNFTLIDVKQNITNTNLNLISVAQNPYHWNNHLIKQINNQHIVNQALIVGNTLSGKTTTISPFQHLADILNLNSPNDKPKLHSDIVCEFKFLAHNNDNDISLPVIYKFEKQNHKVVKEQIILDNFEISIDTIHKQVEFLKSTNTNIDFNLADKIEQYMIDSSDTLEKEDKIFNYCSILFGNNHNKNYDHLPLFQYIQKQDINSNNDIEYDFVTTILFSLFDYLYNHFYYISNNAVLKEPMFLSIENVDYYNHVFNLIYSKENQIKFNKFLEKLKIQTIDFEKFNLNNDSTQTDFENILLNFPTAIKNLIKYYFVLFENNNQNQPKLIVIDDFDAGFNIQTIETIIDIVKEKYGQECQCIFTLSSSFNTEILSNNNTRPDCCFIVKNNQLEIKSFTNSTIRELKRGYNIPTLYLCGEFDM